MLVFGTVLPALSADKPTEPTIDRTSIVITAVRRSRDESVGNW